MPRPRHGGTVKKSQRYRVAGRDGTRNPQLADRQLFSGTPAPPDHSTRRSALTRADVRGSFAPQSPAGRLQAVARRFARLRLGKSTVQRDREAPAAGRLATRHESDKPVRPTGADPAPRFCCIAPHASIFAGTDSPSLHLPSTLSSPSKWVAGCAAIARCESPTAASRPAPWRGRLPPPRRAR